MVWTPGADAAGEARAFGTFARESLGMSVRTALASDSPRVVVMVSKIHHSFLPAFAGGKPYHQAHARGVKLIGATAHYATAELDDGPIIAQDVARVSHRHNPAELMRLGKDLEKTVFARAVRHHLENRILVYHNKTVVFN